MSIKKYNTFLFEFAETLKYDDLKKRKYLDWDVDKIISILKQIPHSKVECTGFSLVYTEQNNLEIVQDVDNLYTIDDDIQLVPTFTFLILIEDESIKNNYLIDKEGIQEILSDGYVSWDYMLNIHKNIDSSIKNLSDDFYVFFDISSFTNQRIDHSKVRYQFIIELSMKDKFDKTYILGK